MKSNQNLFKIKCFKTTIGILTLMTTVPILAQQSPSPLSKAEAKAVIESCLKENNLEVTQKDQPLTDTNQEVIEECLRKKGIRVHKHSKNH